MAKQIEGVYDRVLESAEKEFLDKGFNNASLRVIAKEAETSTGSIYTRFGDKKGLFESLVKPTLDELMELTLKIQNGFDYLDADVKENTIKDYTMENHNVIIDFIYDNKNTFLLLLNSSNGTDYENFMDEFIEIEEKYTLRYLKDIGCNNMLENPVALEFLHILSTLYCQGMFEPLLHNMSREEAYEFDKMFSKYNTEGFCSIFNSSGKSK